MKITELDEANPAALHCHYDGQIEAQPVYIEIDPEAGTVSADCNGEIGNAIPMNVYHGRIMRVGIPCLTASAANRLMRDLLPLVEKLAAGYTCEWDGSNNVGRLTDEAMAALEAIQYRCMYTEPFDGTDYVQVVDSGDIADEIRSKVTSDMTDEELSALENQIEGDCKADGAHKVRGLAAALESMRDELRSERDEDTPDALQSIRDDKRAEADEKADKLTYSGKEIELTSDPGISGGSFPIGDQANYNGNWYQADAVDSNGNEYVVYWTTVDWDAEDESEACDWENPDYIKKVGVAGGAQDYSDVKRAEADEAVDLTSVAEAILDPAAEEWRAVNLADEAAVNEMNATKTKFDHPQLPAGWVTTAEFLRACIQQGHIRYVFGSDGGSIIEPDEVMSYLADDEENFVHTVWRDGDGSRQSGRFRWIGNRRIELDFETI